MDYLVSLMVFATIYTIAALSFNLLIGHAGIFSVAHAAFIEIGAYATGILTSRMIGLFPVALVLGAVVSAAVGWVFARATLRVSGDYMVVASFALLVIFGQIFTNWISVTGGGIGLASIPRPGFVDGALLGSDVLFCLMCLFIAALMYFVSHRLVYSPLGRVLRALRENQDAAASLGKFVRRFRGVVFAVSSAMAAVSGSLYAHFMSYISPLDFTVQLTVLVLTMVIVAGTGRLWTVPVASALVMGITDGVRYVDLPEQIAPGAQQVIYGLLLLLFAVLRPEGLLGRKKDEAARAARRWRSFDEPPRTTGAVGSMAAGSLRGKGGETNNVNAAPKEMLRIDGLNKHFGGLHVIRDVSVTVERGKVTALIGPNGAGKTTLFNLVTGTVPPDGGVVTYEGRRISGLRPDQVAQAGIGRTYQDLKLFAQLTCEENVMTAFPDQPGKSAAAALFARGRVQRREAEIRARTAEILAFLGLADKRNELARDLGYAEAKMLALARVLALDPQLLMLDEPCSGLGRAALDKVCSVMNELVAQGRTICLIEHNMALVREVADRGIFLEHGSLVASGNVETLMANEGLRRRYLGLAETA